MQSLSASLVSLHSRVGSVNHDTKTTKTKVSAAKPSLIYFLALFYAFLSMGFGTGLIGPTLLKLGEQTHVTLEQLVYILFARSFGFFAGTLLGGILIDRFTTRGRSFLAFAILIMCLQTLSIPFIYHIGILIVLQLIWGITAGMVDNLAQILTLHHYTRQQVNPYLQALHGAFGIGAFLSPLIVAPLLSEHRSSTHWHYAYWLIGLLQVPNFILIFYYALRDEWCSTKILEINVENDEFIADDKPTEPVIVIDKKSKSWRTIVVMILITLFILLNVGSESAFGSYIHTYSIFHLHFPKDIAAYLNSAFWASFAIGRLLGIPLSIKFSPLQMIAADILGSIGSLILILVLNKSSVILWIGSILFGLFIASIYPSTIAYAEEHISLTGKRMSMLAVGGSTGDAVIPLLIGYSISSTLTGPIGFILISLTVVIVGSLLFGLIALCAGTRKEGESAVSNRI